MTAKTVEDVILGEARAGDYEDMAHIASVIENRARMTGTTPEQVVQNSREFNAYGKPLPKGVDRYRDKARQALQQIRTQGPVTNATFYATPKAQGNLPKGLSQTGQTKGHVYFTDPKARPINTAIGTKRLNMQGLPSVTPRGMDAISGIMKSEGARFKPKGGGLADLVRSQPLMPEKAQGLTPQTQAFYKDVANAFGPVGIKSGYRDPEKNRAVGGARSSQHLSRRAVDLATKDMSAADRKSMLAMAYDDKRVGGIGLYPSGAIHIDTRPKSGATGAVMWGGGGSYSKDPQELRDLAKMDAGDRYALYGGRTLPRTGAPTPTPRPSRGMDAIMQVMAPAKQFQQPNRPITPTPSRPTAIASAARTIGTALAPSQAQAATMPMRQTLAPDRPVPRGVQAIQQVMQPQRPITPTPQRAAQPNPLAAQYAQYRPMVPEAPKPAPMTQTAKPAQSAMAAQYAQYRPAPVQNVPVPQLVSAPFPNKPRQSFNPKQAALGAAAGGAIGGLGGIIGGGMLGNKMANASAVNSAFGLKPQSPIASMFGSMFGPRNSQPVQPTSYVTGNQFAGGGAQASGFVQGGGAPVGTGYRDSMGGTSMAGNGYSDRTDRFGNTLRTFDNGRTASVGKRK